MASAGSSPLTRGKLVAAGRAGAKGGLIPAHAGNTTRLAHLAFPLRAHPHSCGENSRARSSGVAPNGSSPLTRGKRGAAVPASRRIGLIPAHAGKTGARRSSPGNAGAHPRSRGENISPIECMSSRMGSSPLTRGKLMSLANNGVVRGLIPTHAGKTWCASARPQRSRAHPR